MIPFLRASPRSVSQVARFSLLDDDHCLDLYEESRDSSRAETSTIEDAG